jgi:hyperosmotically inducible periplasmic protein
MSALSITLQKGQAMNAKLVISSLIVGTLLAPVASYAVDSDSDRTHPMTFVKDSAITAKVKAKLASENLGSLAHLTVDTDRSGKVILSGTVGSQAEAEKAVSLARRTEGVNSVSSSIQVKRDE